MKSPVEYEPAATGREPYRHTSAVTKGRQRMLTAHEPSPFPPAKIEELPLHPSTLQQLFDRWKTERWVELGKSNQVALNSAYRHCAALADWQYRDIKAPQMQWCIDHSNRSYAMQSTIKSLWGHLDRYAQDIGVLPKVSSEALTVPPAPSSDRPVFSKSELALLWKQSRKPWVDTILFQLYSGARVNEMIAIRVTHVDLQANTLLLGEGTERRLVPIHPKIRPIVERWMDLSTGDYLLEHRNKPVSSSNYRVVWRGLMEELGLTHTPNHCRNTFQSQLEEVNIRPALQKALMDFESSYIPTGEYSQNQISDLKKAIQSIF